MVDIQLSQIMPTEERIRCAEIALDIWKKKPAKYAEWYKRVGREIAAEILGIEEMLIKIGLSKEEAVNRVIKLTQIAADVATVRDLEKGEVKITAQSYEDHLKKKTDIDRRREWEGNWD